MTDEGDAPRPRILVVDDEPDIRAFLSIVFEHEGFLVDGAGDAADAQQIIDDHGADIVILDLDLPGTPGLEFLASLRERGELPVIVVSGRGEEADRVLGLDLGADDYLAKPFSPPELLARVRSVLRRARGRGAAPETQLMGRLDFGGLVIDTESHEVVVSGAPVEMSRKEFELLHFLAVSPKKVFSREELLAAVWGSAPGEQGVSTVTEHVRRIRQKIEADPDEPRWIATVRGIGYRFEP
jgi:DNA-binding response OmpR family regulator